MTRNKENLFNEDFCVKLEFALCDAVEYSDNKPCWGFGCDGVNRPISEDERLSKKSIRNNQCIETTCLAGQVGQELYQIVVFLGKRALHAYAKGNTLIDCVPEDRSSEWWYAEPSNKYIEVYLE